MVATSNIAEVARFQESVNQFARTLPENLIKPFVKKIALEALTRLIAKTPVDEGRARGGWFVSIGEARPGEQVARLDIVGGKAPVQVEHTFASSPTWNAGLAALAGMQPFGVIWIQNNVAYVPVLEAGRIEGGGYADQTASFAGRLLRRQGATGSLQAPNGMLRLTVLELQQMFETGDIGRAA